MNMGKPTWTWKQSFCIMSSEEHSEGYQDLQLSQETMNQVMRAVGVDGNNLSQIFQTEVEDDEEESSGSSSLSISRMIFKANSLLPLWGPLSQSSGFGSQPLASSTSCSNHQLPISTTNQLVSQEMPSSPISLRDNSTSPQVPNSTSSHCKYGDGSPLISAANPILPVLYPLSQGSQFTCTLPTVDVDSSQSIRTNIPSNMPLKGDYGFEVVLDTQARRVVSKNANFTFSTMMNQAYIKRNTVIPFNFFIKRVPPPQCIIRAMCIHKAPEMIGQNLICCPKHVDTQKNQGALFPYHFVRPQANDNVSMFCEDRWKRLSITTPFAALQKKPGNVYTGLFLFPCFTSDFSKSGQMVQVIFTLECDSDVLGRAVLDIRVCSSTGRDREVDEKKIERVRASNEQDGGAQPVSTRRRRKRAAATPGNQTDVLQCTMPPQKVCRLSSQKVHYSIYTYPELIPFIDVCVKMMEQVNSVPVDVGDSNTPAATEHEAQQPTFSSLESWLEHLGLSRHLKMLHDHGVSQVFQLSGITEEELKRWGMRNAQHRKKFLEGVNLIVTSDGPVTVNGRDQDDMEVSGSPPLFSSQSSPPTQPLPTQPPPSQPLRSSQTLSQGSQHSVLSTQPFSSSFELVQIQVRKRLDFDQQK